MALGLGVASMAVAPSTAAAVDAELEVKVVPLAEPNDTYFGEAVAVSADAVLVGAPRTRSSGIDGSVSLLRPRTSNTLGYDETRLVPSDAASTTYFGLSVAIDGETYVVGSANGVYVFTSNAGGGFDETKLDVSSKARVAASNGTIVVGAANAASVFVPNTAGGYDETVLDAPSMASAKQFGIAVDIDGDTIVVGASGSGGSRPGNAYVYVADGSGTYARTSLAASDGSADDEFGYSVAIDGDRILVGAIEGDGASDDTGAVYLFDPDGAGGYVETKLTASNGEPGDRFGNSVAITDTGVVVGSPAADTASGTGGAVYSFDSDGNGGYVETRLVSSDISFGDRFGRAVAASDDIVVVGAVGQFRDAGKRGAVYVYDPDRNPATTEASLTIVQETPSNDATDFSFGGSFGPFRLDDPTVDDGDDVTDRVTFTRSAGSVVIRQTSYSRWTRPLVDCAGHEFVSTPIFQGTRISLSLASSDEVTCTFVNERFSGVLSSRVFNDVDANGTRNVTDPWLEGWTVNLFDENGFLADSASTNADGRVEFSALESGQYSACLDVKNRWFPTKPPTLDPIFAMPCEPVAYTNGDRTFLRFGVSELDVGEEIELIPQVVPTDHLFGAAVAISGESILVGSPAGGASVSLFRPGTDGVYSETRIGQSGAAARDFGRSVDIDGDTFVVGSKLFGLPGAAYVYTPDGTGSFSETRLNASNGAAGDRFGFDVAVSGTTVVVGATGSSANDSAGVFVFTPDGAGGYDEVELEAPTQARGRQFGRALDIVGDTIVVSAPNDNPDGVRSGSVYVYTRDASGDFERTRLAPSDGDVDDSFGFSVAIADGAIVVGAIDHDGPAVDSGAVYVYRPDGAGGYNESKFVASDGAEGDRFGQSVAISGTTIVVGATGVESATGPASNNDGGATYVFEADGSGGNAETRLVSSAVEPNDRYGAAVAVADDIVVIGASGVNRGTNIEGAVYVLRD